MEDECWESAERQNGGVKSPRIAEMSGRRSFHERTDRSAGTKILPEELDGTVSALRAAVLAEGKALSNGLETCPAPSGPRTRDESVSFGITLASRGCAIIARSSCAATFEGTGRWAAAQSSRKGMDGAHASD